jgi:LuxR family maltose regulon positive regulatory protein
LFGDQPLPLAGHAHLGMARVYYEWNDLDAAQQHGQRSSELARYVEHDIRFVANQVFLARLKLARGDVDGAMGLLAKAEQSARQRNFLPRLPEIVTVQVPVLIRLGQVATAAGLASQCEFPLSRARVLIAQDESSAALTVLEQYRKQMEARGWANEKLHTIVLQAIAFHAHGEKDKAIKLLGEALALAEPGGFIRLFIDEGPLMAELLAEAAAFGIMPEYIRKLLAAFEAEKRKTENKPDLSSSQSTQPLSDPLSQRELEVLRLIARGLSNREIGERLFLALSTVKGHNRIIFDKLQVQSRTEALSRARELGLL